MGRTVFLVLSSRGTLWAHFFNAIKAGAWPVLFDPKYAIAATTPIATAFKFCTRHRENGLLDLYNRRKLVFLLLTRFLYREVTSPQQAWAPKTRFWGKAFYFTRKSPWSISDLPGAFCIEQVLQLQPQLAVSNRHYITIPVTVYLCHCWLPEAEYDHTIGKCYYKVLRSQSII